MIPLRDENPTTRRPVVTVVLIIVNIAVFFLVQPQSDTAEGFFFSFEWAAIPCELVSGEPLSEAEVGATVYGEDDTACDLDRSIQVADGAGRTFRLSPDVAAFEGKSVQLAVLVSMFLHGSLLHLGGNMLFLWVFGNNVEDHLGPVRYLLFYLAGGVVATLAHVAIEPGSTVPVIGASGAVAAVMGAYLVWFPRAPVRTLIFLGFIVLFPRVPAALLLALWFGSQFFIGPDEGVAWMAHVGGFVFGAGVGLLVRESSTVRDRVWADTYRSDRAGRWDDRHGGRRL